MQSVQLLPLQGMQQVVYNRAPNINNSIPIVRYRHDQSKLIGVAEILIGVACIVFNSISIGLSGYGTGYVIWNGVLFIVCGSFGIAAGAKKKKYLIITFMVLCIISAALTALVISGSIQAALTASKYPKYYELIELSDCSTTMPPGCTVYKIVIAMEALLAIMAFLEAIFAIWGSVICCKAIGCCSSKDSTNGMMLVPQYDTSANQITFGNPAQATYQQVTYYVGPTPLIPAAANNNIQFTSGPSVPLLTESNIEVQSSNPPPYSQVQMTSHPGSTVQFSDAQC